MFKKQGKKPFVKLIAVKSIAVAINIVILIAACSNQDDEVVVVDIKKHEATTSIVNIKGQLNPNEVVLEEGVIDTDQSGGRLQQQIHAKSLDELLIMVKDGKLISRTKVMKDSTRTREFASTRLPNAYFTVPTTDNENYIKFKENSIQLVSETPISTFSIDVDTAAYSNIRRMIMAEGRLPPKDAVKIEEMINYFSYDYTEPKAGEAPFSVSVEMAPAPWNNQHQILQVGLLGFEPAVEERPAANLVFLVDVSGSMHSANKLTLVKKSLRLLVNKMNNEDRIALVVYAGAAGLVLESTPGDQRAKILLAIDSLSAGGSTNGGAGIELAYNVAQQHFIQDGINRVLIASDGDMNVGTVSLDALKELIVKKRDSGIELSTLGYGSGNYNFALMEQLADVGNGNAAYIDSLKEAHKVLVEEMQSTLLTIAKDVKIQIEFNPALVSEYRLLGYENRLLNREDFRNDKVDAGEIGAGHTVTALYELTMVGSDGAMIPEKRYGQQQTQAMRFVKQNSNELAFIRLRYKQPSGDTSTEFSMPVNLDVQKGSISAASNDLQFAIAVAGFGQVLRGGKYTGNWDYEDVLSLARNSRGEDKHGYRSELISLVALAQSLSPRIASAEANL